MSIMGCSFARFRPPSVLCISEGQENLAGPVSWPPDREREEALQGEDSQKKLRKTDSGNCRAEFAEPPQRMVLL